MKQGLKRLLAVAATSTTFMLSSAVCQASVTTAKIQRILIYEGGSLVYVYPAGGILNPPSCANATYYSFSMNRPRAKEYLAGLLAAQAQGATVNFYGSGACTDQSVSEALAYFAFGS